MDRLVCFVLIFGGYNHIVLSYGVILERGKKFKLTRT